MTEACGSVDAQEIWGRYLQGLNEGRSTNRFNEAEKCWRFFEGDQWYGIDAGGARLPFYNFIAPTVNYKKARVAMNSKSITFSADEKDEKGVLEAVNDQVKEAWEYGKMDKVCWAAVKNAMVCGNAFLYFPDGRIFDRAEKLCRCNDRRKFVQVFDGCRVFLGDETEEELQSQPYIIIEERRLTKQIREEARVNGCHEDDVQGIVSDVRSEAQVTTEDAAEPKADGGYTTSILYLERAAEGIRFCRAVQGLIYQPFRTIEGLDYYPVVDYTVKRKKGSARGIGEVNPMIANQIEVNRTLVRRLEAGKMASYPKLVYDEDTISNPEDLTRAGAAIAVSGGVTLNSVMERVGYLQAQPTSADATHLGNEMISTTKELAGAGDAALGNINPEQASGAAITAVQDQADIPMNEEVSDFYQMIEDIATLWYHLIMAYNRKGYEGKNGAVSVEELRRLCPKIAVDVSSTIPNTVTAQVNGLYNLLAAGYITFEEFLDLVGNRSNLPIAKLKALREEKLKEQRDQQASMMEQTALELEAEEAEQQMGGMLEAEDADLFNGILGGV